MGTEINTQTPLGLDRSPLLEAARLVIDREYASAPMLQRKLRVGFARACRLILLLEERRIVGAASPGTHDRPVLVPRADVSQAIAAIQAESDGAR